MTSIATSSTEKPRNLVSRLSRNMERTRLKIPVISHISGKVFWIALLVVVVAGSSAGVYAAVTPATATATTSAAALQTATARTGDLILRASGTGYLVAASESSVGFTTSGKLVSLAVKLGDTVEAGQLLAELDDTAQQLALATAQQSLREMTSASAIASAQAAVAADEKALTSAQIARANLDVHNQATIANAYAAVVMAQSNLDNAKSNYESVGLPDDDPRKAQSYQALYDAQQKYDSAVYLYNAYSGHSSQATIDAADAAVALATANLSEARNYLVALTGGDVPADATGTALAQLAQAKLNIQTAQLNLDNTKLYAPISGLVMTLNAKVGDRVQGTIMTIDDLSKANIQFYMDASDWSNVKLGYAVDVSFDSLPNQTFTGTVTEVMPGLVSVQGSSMVEGTALLDNSVADIGLPVGVDAAIDVISGQALNATLVPIEALHQLPDGTYTVFVMKNGTPTLTTVEVGLQSDTFAVISSGVSVGDVVTTGIVETSK